MKGLTPTERELLTRTGNGCNGREHREADSGEVSTLSLLIEQGRVAIVKCPCHPEWSIYQITPQGRDALNLWDRIKQFFHRDVT